MEPTPSVHQPFIHWLPAITFGWTGLCALAMLSQTRLLQGQSYPLDGLAGFVLCATWFAYNFLSTRRWQRWAGWASGAAAVFFWSSLNSTAQLMAVAAGLFWGLYYGLQRPGNAGLRAIPILKPLSVAAAWAWVTVLLPMAPLHGSELALMGLGRSAFVFALALAYDLHDLQYDLQQGLDTLALRLGQQRTFSLIYTALVCAALCAAGNFFLKKITPLVLLALLFSLLISAVWLRFLFQKNHETAWRKLWIDAAMIAQFVLVEMAVS